MLRRRFVVRVLAAWSCLALIGSCGSDEPGDDASLAAGAGAVGGSCGSDASGGSPGCGAAPACKPMPSTCPDIDIVVNSSKACCTPAYDCGYELPLLSEETKALFPDGVPLADTLTKDDPNGRCAPESFFFGPRPPLYDHKVDVDGGEDVLITEQCESFQLIATFILPGCCLPDNTCGLSTDESAPTLNDLAPGNPFGKPECVTAEVLNQQFRDSALASFARTTAMGTCDYAALAVKLTNTP